jgi:hypothetical protein
MVGSVDLVHTLLHNCWFVCGHRLPCTKQCLCFSWVLWNDQLVRTHHHHIYTYKYTFVDVLSLSLSLLLLLDFSLKMILNLFIHFSIYDAHLTHTQQPMQYIYIYAYLKAMCGSWLLHGVHCPKRTACSTEMLHWSLPRWPTRHWRTSREETTTTTKAMMMMVKERLTKFIYSRSSFSLFFFLVFVYLFFS